MIRNYRHQEETAEIEKSLFFGLDLGQSKDYSALAIVEAVRTVTANDNPITQLNCIHLQRWKLRTSYPQIVADVVRMINNLAPERTEPIKPVLAIDNTGVGAPVTDLFKREQINAQLIPIQIVGGATVSRDSGVTRVPKRDLVSVVQVALQNRTLKIADALEEAATLARELQNFQVRITDSANDQYGAWREGTHDDLVLACALALWTAQNESGFYITERIKALFRGV